MLIASLLIYALYALIILILVRVVFSWTNPYPNNSVYRFVYQVTEPILAPVRHRLPPMSGMDLSPLVVTLAAYFVIAAIRNLSGA
ncbi:MAG TPA: YggT family protein [Candidatus Dormibacteraeota bacterium]|jgi:YggT family protein|nr:YggT family protein [Candidatus Dormibacteraeota bacterium]